MIAKLVSNNKEVPVRAYYEDDLLFIESDSMRTAIDTLSPNIKIERNGFLEIVRDSASGIHVEISNA